MTRSSKLQFGAHYKVLALALAVFMNAERAASEDPMKAACGEILGAPTSATATVLRTIPASRAVELELEVFWGTFSGTARCEYPASDSIITSTSFVFNPPLNNGSCVGNAFTVEALDTAYTTIPAFRQSVKRKFRRNLQPFLDAEEINRGCPNRPSLCAPTSVTVTSVMAFEAENTVSLDARVTWSNRSGTATCKLEAANATLTATALTFDQALTSDLCTDTTGTGASAALVSRYADDGDFRSSVIGRLTDAGEVLRHGEEIRRGCPNHPTWCEPESISIESVSKNFSLFAVELVATVEWIGSSGLAVTGTTTCTFPLRDAELTSTALIFGAPKSEICREDVAGTMDELIKRYDADAAFRTDLDTRLTNEAEMWRREVEISRGCPNYPTWCDPENVNIASVTPNNATQVVVLDITVFWQGATGLTATGTTSCNFPAAEATLTASALVFGAPSRSNCIETLTDTTSALIHDYRYSDAAFRADVNSRLSAAAEPWRRQIEIDAGCPNHPGWCQPSPPPPRPPSRPPPRRWEGGGCMPDGSWPSPGIECP